MTPDDLDDAICEERRRAEANERRANALEQEVAAMRSEMATARKFRILQELVTLRQEQARLTADLATCYRLTGADPDGNEDWRLAKKAVEAVRELRAAADRADARVDTLRAALEHIINLVYPINHPAASLIRRHATIALAKDPS